ncbi:MAG: competence/damage-inducible protein A [Flavobacteriales bacterium]|nr:MAG: competence/damage-inducible protein A [Flavobacteriales bacterium]
MNLDIISIGDELLIGQTLNTNAFWISKELNKIGFTIRQQITIADTETAILTALETALSKSDVVIFTGGLGPTSDDLTMPALNKYFGGSLMRDDKVYQHIKKMITSRGFEMNRNNQNQALVPDNCRVIYNANGTAPGLWFEKEGKVVIAMPGVPYEMKAMVTDEVIPKLKEQFDLPEIINQMVYTQGMPESMLAERIFDWENNLPETIKLAYLPSPGRVKLCLSSTGTDRGKLQHNINVEIEKLAQLIPQYIYSADNEDIATVVGELLRKNKLTLATAESCTGGYIAHLITRIAGSSDYYKGSVIAYSNEVKINELSVNADDIDKYGAVSEQVVQQMAVGVKNKMNTDYAIAISGIAGPTGGTDQKPVGTVWIALATPKGTVAKKHVFGKQRDVNIERAAITALGVLRKELG